MKKRIYAVILVLLCIACLATLVTPFAAAGTPSATVKGHNVAVSPDVAGGADIKKDEKLHLLYYVDFQNVPAGAEVGVLIWKNRQSSYVYGKQDAKLSAIGTYGTYAKFSYDEISARMMTQDIFAVPYIKSGDNITYGKVDKYSVLQYAYNKKGSSYTSNDISGTLGALLEKLLDRGADAQQYYGYKVNRLANGTYYQLSLVNGVLDDKTERGLYQFGEKVAATAEIDDFDHWEDASGKYIGDSQEIVITVKKEETYTATNDVHMHQWNDGVITTPATCTKPGTITYTCQICEMTTAEDIPATGHTPAAAVEENRVEATCTVAGSYDTVVYCSVCGTELSRETTEIPAPGHKYSDPEFIISDDGQSAYYRKVCSACGDVSDEPFSGVVIRNVQLYTFVDGVRVANNMPNGFFEYESNTYYIFNNIVVTNYFIVENRVYYFGVDGILQDITIDKEFITIDGNEYYVVNNFIVTNYYIINDVVYYFDEDGIWQKDFVVDQIFITIGANKYYVINNVIVKGYYIINNFVYYFGDDGVLQDITIDKEFIVIGDNTYYVVNNIIVTNYYIINNVVYYFGDDGVWQEDFVADEVFITIGGNKYYVVNNIIVTNYYIINNVVYYFGEDGVWQEDVETDKVFIKVGGDTYYVVNNVIVTNYYVINNVVYYFGTNGVWQKDAVADKIFIEVEGDTYYVVNNVVVTNYYIIDNVVYYFGDNGVWQDIEINNIFITIEDKEYYVVNNTFVKNYYVVNNVMYYFGDDGAKQDVEINNVFVKVEDKEYYVVNNNIVKNYYVVNNVVYYFGEDGVKQDVTVDNVFVKVEDKEYYVVNNNIVKNYYVVNNTMYYFGDNGVKQNVTIDKEFIYVGSDQYYVVNNTIVKNYYVVNNTMYYFGDDGVNQGAVHEFVWVGAQDATCTEDGVIAHYDCLTCDKHFDAEYNEIENVVATALGHDLISHEAKEATCTEIGWAAYVTCSRCDYTTYIEIPANGHTEVIDKAVDPTCTETGLTEGSHCSVCGEVIVAQETVKALGHVAGEAVEENLVEATCTEAGSYDSVVYCSVCEAELSRESKVIEAVGHQYGDDNVCDICGAILVKTDLVVEDKSANAGDEIKISVAIENNPGFLTMALDFYYDESAMTLTKVQRGSLLKVRNDDDEYVYSLTSPASMASGCRAAWYATDLPEKIEDGELIILTFTIKDTAESGTYNVTVSDTKDGSNEFEFAAATGYITVN